MSAFVAHRLVLALLIAAALPVAAADARRPKKLIETGWDHVDSRKFLELRPQMEQLPFDGVVVDIMIDNPKMRKLFGRTFAADAWQQDWLRPAVEELKQVKTSRLKDNFLLVNANPGTADWLDDEAWKNVVEHWRLAAWAVRESGLKGILFDPEPYAPPHAQFMHSAQAGYDKHSFAEYYAAARRRGQEVMRVVAKECPNLTLFCYFMNSVCGSATNQSDPRRALAAHHYGLYPAFIDGWLDAAPPSVTFVDGCESAYRFNSRRDFLEAAAQIRGACQELVSPENRAKYRAQVQVGFGIYLDAHWNPPGSPWFIDGLGGSRVARLGANVSDALSIADEYVWLYGEKHRWWPTDNKRISGKSWPEALPGCLEYLQYARDPLALARKCLAESRQAAGANCLQNAAFSADSAVAADGKTSVWKEGRAPAGWSAWQDTKSKGAFTWDRQEGASAKGSAQAAGVAWGCFLQGCDAMPGQRFVVRAMCKKQGRGDVTISVRWQTSESRWTAEARDRVFHAQGPDDQWSEALGTVEVPDGAGRLLVLLGVRGQQTPDDKAWFDDVEVYLIKFE